MKRWSIVASTASIILSSVLVSCGAKGCNPIGLESGVVLDLTSYGDLAQVASVEACVATTCRTVASDEAGADAVIAFGPPTSTAAGVPVSVQLKSASGKVLDSATTVARWQQFSQSGACASAWRIHVSVAPGGQLSA